MPNIFKRIDRSTIKAAFDGFVGGIGWGTGFAMVGMVASLGGILLSHLLGLPPVWRDRSLTALATSGFIAALTLLFAFIWRSKGANKFNAPPIAAASSVQDEKMDYFELGLALGNSHQFNDLVLRDLQDRCNALGLKYSAAKLARILDSFDEERDEIEIKGGTITKTLAIFQFQMQDIEDAVRSELQRIPTGPKQHQRAVTSEQWRVISDLYRTTGHTDPGQLKFSLKLPDHDLEAERYAQDFSRVFFCGCSTDAKIGPALTGLIIRVRDKNVISPAAQLLSKALTAAGIEHRIDSLNLQFPIHPASECELIIARNP